MSLKRHSFNSLFEMPKSAWIWADEGVLSMVSILCLRCACGVVTRVERNQRNRFNSLFEMQILVRECARWDAERRVSILCLRCSGLMAHRGLTSATRCFNSLFEMHVPASVEDAGGGAVSILCIEML